MLKCGLIHFRGDRYLRRVHPQPRRQLGFESRDKLTSNAIVELLDISFHCCY